MLKLLDTYRSILGFCGCYPEPNEKEQIYVKLDSSGAKSPATMQGRKWVLPTEENCKNAYVDNLALFHPLSENIIKSESADIKRLRTCLSVRMNYALYKLICMLLEIASSPEKHTSLSPEQTEMCVALKKVTKDQLMTFSEVAYDAINRADGVFQLVHVFLSRGTTLDGKKFSRVGNISFPFYEKLKEGAEICGKKITSTESKIFIRVLEYIFPDIGKLNAYSYGSNSATAPYLDALMKSGYNVVTRILELTDTFEPFIIDSVVYDFDTRWLEVFQDLKGYEPEIRKVAVTQSSNDYAANTASHQQPARPDIKMTNAGIDATSLINLVNNRQMQPQQGFLQQQQPILGLQQRPMLNQQTLKPYPDWAIGKPQQQTYPQVYNGYQQVPMNYGYPQVQAYPQVPYQPMYQNQGYGYAQQQSWVQPQPQQGWVTQQPSFNLCNARVSR